MRIRPWLHLLSSGKWKVRGVISGVAGPFFSPHCTTARQTTGGPCQMNHGFVTFSSSSAPVWTKLMRNVPVVPAGVMAYAEIKRN